MSKYQAYESYKDSGVEWLGEIPKHWEAVGLTKYLYSLVDYRGKTPEKTNDGIFLVTAKNIKNGVIDYSLSQEFVSEDKYNEIMRRGKPQISDVLLTTEAPLGEVANVDNTNIALAQRIIKMQGKTKNLNNYFLKYWILGSSFSQNLQSLCTGSTALGIKASKLCLLRVVLPTLEEQKAIARFLDYKTNQIDALIAKKEALLEKLDEKRTALISHAVTKGLDPNVPMKDSGIEWLGVIPEHWEVLKVKHLTRILRGKFTHRPRNDPKLYDGQYPFIQTGDVANADKFITEYTQTLNDDGYAVSKEFPSGTLVMTIAANIGDMAILDFGACFPDSIVGFIPSEKTGIFFLYYLFTSMKEQFLTTAVLNTQLNLNVERISNQFTVISPIKEQKAIAEYLDRKTTEIDNQKGKIQQAIDLLKEYRTALITNAVTGKIDVRQVSIPQAQI